ncbi:hypothetical protein [Neomoorella thermoacetica]|uniref:hypothetical protein n=1 Tax=Neomoorella thermoacetica TaxID=1525 RepID=UPI0030D39EC3
MNMVCSIPSIWLHELDHESVLKKNGYTYQKTLLTLVPNVKILEPILLQDYREALLAPFKSSFVMAVLVIFIIISLGPSLSPLFTVFVTMRIALQFLACSMDLFWALKTRSLPDSWWIVECGKNSYICPQKEKAIELLKNTVPTSLK